jgi:cytochrome d ubiquinol oxidase subunit II
MLYVVITFLLVSVFLYCLLGGADFGGGIIELFSRGKNKEKVQELISISIAPIWEANHMWLIITVVILFNAFPAIYSLVSVSLYIPLILLLIGIVLRGSAFAFRHYDAFKDSSQKIYSRVFRYSSLMVTFFFGLIIGAIISGKISFHPVSFYEGYIEPWFNFFSISVGLFLISLFSFLAAVFLIGDSEDKELIKVFTIKSKQANIASVITGGMVFASSLIEQNGFAERFITNPVSLLLIILASILLPVLWKILNDGLKWPSRILAGTQMLLILGAFYAVYFPVIVRIRDGNDLTLFNSHAPAVTQNYLGWALIIGSVIIFPALFYLYKVFQLERETKN